jgi:peptidyl-prolyl cis-trans isomerase C
MTRIVTVVCICCVAALSACGRTGGEPSDADSTAVADTTARVSPSTIGARHILIAYAGAQSSSATRTKEEALQQITDIRSQIESGAISFEDAAIQYSDCPSGAEGGDLGVFGRGAMVAEFENAAFALETGGMSGIVETPFGYHLIKRTE